ncbi:TIGR02757 family protein [bacterium]|nr:TIGR02757 family protein [bacterium]
MKNKLDALRKQYEVKEFIYSDPIQFPHKFQTLEDIEISAFLASGFAYGKRELFIQKLNLLFEIMNNKPLEFILGFEDNKEKLKGFNYRFIKDFDLVCVLELLNKLYAKKSNLRELFYNSKAKNGSLQGVCDYFYSNCNNLTAGFCHFLPNPKNGGALKRLNMFLRWMTRDGEVDLGVWDIYKKSELLIPLDTHVATISREFNLLTRSSNDFKAVIELTEKLKEFNPDDPTGYDFALFGLGVNR